jgi:hypothetical protein
MSTIATATLQTPWDCRWSRFGRMRSTRPDARVEGLWVCVYHNGERRPIDASVCEACPHWEYEPPLDRPSRQSSPEVPVESLAVAACPHVKQAGKRLEIGTRVVALALAALLAGMGFVVLTRPLAFPLTISLWMGALASFLLGVWGRFNRQGTPEESW